MAKESPELTKIREQVSQFWQDQVKRNLISDQMLDELDIIGADIDGFCDAIREEA